MMCLELFSSSMRIRPSKMAFSPAKPQAGLRANSLGNQSAMSSAGGKGRLVFSFIVLHRHFLIYLRKLVHSADERIFSSYG